MSHNRWTWVVGDPAPSGTRQRELATAYGRHCTFRTDGYAWAQFSLDGRQDEVLEIAELATDLWVYRNEDLLFRGRITTETDDINLNKHWCQFSAVDYRGMLQFRRALAGGVQYVDTDEGTIMWNVVQYTQGQTNGNWGVTNGLGATSGTKRTLDLIEPGTPLLDPLASFARKGVGFEWEISPELELNRWYPHRGADNNVILDWGGTIQIVKRILQPADFGNVAISTGSATTIAAVETAGDIATDPRGRWEVAFASPNTVQQSTVDEKADWLLAEAGVMRPEWTLEMASQGWDGPDHLWIGDTAKLVVKSGRLNVNQDVRIAEIQAICGDDGTERIMVGVVAA